MTLLTKEFLDKYPANPSHMTPLGLFVFYRTYSRFLPKEQRRETWKETVARAVEYNVGLQVKHQKKVGLPLREEWLKEEAEKLFDGIFNLRLFPSGRTLFVGGTYVSENFPMANFNCSFTDIERWSDFREYFYLLMLGSGVGIGLRKENITKLPPIRINANLILSPYHPVPKDYRLENTDTRFLENGFAKIYVGDSKEGWCDALDWYFKLLTEEKYEHIHTIKVSFNSVRPAGERLKTFGGTASGPEPLAEMFQGIDNALKNRVDEALRPISTNEKGYGHIRPIHALDIANFIGNNVVVGGVRRTACIALFDPDDYEMLFAKYAINGFWTEDHFRQHEKIMSLLEEHNIPVPAWFSEVGVRNYMEGQTTPHNFGRTNIGHRRMSNNTAVFSEKPTREWLNFIFQLIQLDAEPGFMNMSAAEARRENVRGLNPCAEILLDTKQQCNLTTVNMMAFRREDGLLDTEGLQEAQRLSARAGLRMTLIDLELPEWNEKQKRDRLVGCSLTGTQDAMADLDGTQRAELLTLLNHTANEEAVFYAHMLRIPTPLLVSTCKPEGTLSLVAGGVSPGVHDAHSPYYIRRIRISANDALAKAAIAHGWTVSPEVGTPENKLENARIYVIDFPVKSNAKRTKDDVGALEQLQRYFDFQDNYADHNTSNTITVRPEEWEDIEDQIYSNWDKFIGVSFLAHDGGTYQLAPYEAIDKETYDKMVANYMPFEPEILELYETTGESLLDADDPDCATGGCPVR